MRSDGETDRAPWATPAFELSGGALCLDLANTVGDRPLGGSEQLRSYRDLLAWALQAGVLEAGEADDLALTAARQPRRAAAALRRLIELREAIYRLFSALAAGEPAGNGDLAALNGALARALPHLAVGPGGPGFGWTWRRDPDDLDRAWWPAARSAAELLTGPDAARVRECAADRCAWLFLDRSRNRSRRWCDMAACGNRQKARRHYARRKAAR